MSTPEAHKVTHMSIDRDLGDLRDNAKDNTNRIVQLEKSETVLNVQMTSTMNSIDQLISWIKWGLGFAIVTYFSFFAWLLQQQIK